MKQNLIDWINATITRYELIKGIPFMQENTSQINAAYVCSLVKGVKDVVRSPYDNKFKQSLLKKVSVEIKSILLSSPYKLLGLKYFLRYRLLCQSTDLFKFIVEKTAVFSFHQNNRKDNLYS